MLGLSYPASLLVVWTCFDALGWSPTLAAQSIVSVWIAFFVVGWVQWFILIPFVANRFSKIFGSQDDVIIVPKT
jgi:hypothetical protein